MLHLATEFGLDKPSSCAIFGKWMSRWVISLFHSLSLKKKNLLIYSNNRVITHTERQKEGKTKKEWDLWFMSSLLIRSWMSNLDKAESSCQGYHLGILVLRPPSPASFPAGSELEQPGLEPGLPYRMLLQTDHWPTALEWQSQNQIFLQKLDLFLTISYLFLEGVMLESLWDA